MGWGSAGTPRWGGLGLGCQQHPRGGGVPSPHWHLLSTASAAPTGLSHAVNLARGPQGRDQVGLQGWKALESPPPPTTTSLPPRPRNAPQSRPTFREEKKGKGCTPHTRPPSLRGRPAAALTRTRRSRKGQEGRRATPPRAVAGGSREAARQKAQARPSGLPAPSGLAPGRQTAPRELTSAGKRKHRGK